MARRHLLLLFLLASSGCGSGEDFNQPPVEIQQRLANGSKSESTTAATAAKAPPSAGENETANSPSVPVESLVDTAAGAEAPANAGSAVTEGDPVAPTPATEETPTDALATAAPEAVDDAAVTASGKTTAEIAEKKDSNSQKSVAGNAKGLLDSLKGNSGSTGADVPGQADPAGEDAQRRISRFGRFAMTRGQWLQLVTKLTRRFFVAATPDGSRIAASSGERSTGVVNTRIELLSGNVQNLRHAASADSTEPILQSITGLAGIINAVELTRDGHVALIGTTDGRLLARSAASTTDWDLYARDLFLYQDEHRRTARLSSEAIVVVRCLPDDRILTVDGNGRCVICTLNEAVHPPTPVLQMTVEQAKEPSPETVPVAATASFVVSGFQVLSVSVSEDGLLGAIVTSSEAVTIFDTNSGAVLDTLDAVHFADTQPVCVEFVPERHEVLVGLADGRIFRRAFAGGTPVSGTDDNGEPVDYDAVFVPDIQDNRGAITCLQLARRHTILYVGSIDGTVSRLDLTHRRLEQTVKRHEGPVLEFRMTPTGVISIGADRRAHLFDMPVTALNPDRDAVRVFQLPVDQTLEESAPEEETAAAESSKNTKKSTRPMRSVAAPVPRNEIDLSLTGIRPSDSTRALLEHQLRCATDEKTKLQLRKALLEHLGQQSAAVGLGSESAEVPVGAPLRTGEITTEFSFSSGEWNRVLLDISDDGTTIASLHRGRENAAADNRAQAICVWDMATGTNLRRWTQAGRVRRLFLDEPHHLMIPTPVIARLSTADGHFLNDPSEQFVSSALAGDRLTMMLGHFGKPGIAGHSLTRISLRDNTLVSGFERFETTISAIAWSGSGDTLFVSTRERDQTRLLEVDPLSLTLRTEINKEKLPGSLTAESADSSAAGTGAIVIVPSPSGKVLLTWGRYEDGPQLRMWRKSNNNWPAEQVTVIRGNEASPDLVMTDCPAVFVNHQDSQLAVLTANGLVILSSKKSAAQQALPIPSFGGHRPVCQFSPDHNWLLTGDGEGTVWAIFLNNLQRKPLKFSAHSGPIAGLALSANGRYLITAGEDNRLRSWRVDGFLKR